MKILAGIKTLTVMVILALSLPALAGFDDLTDYDRLDSEIHDDNLVGVMALLNKTDKPFVTKKGFLDTPHSENDFAERRGIQALGSSNRNGGWY